MHFELEATLNHRYELIWEAIRDHMPDIARYIPDVEKVIVQAREEVEGGLQLVSLWQAKIDLPFMARSFITPDMLQWIDTATWYPGEHRCTWSLHLPYFEGGVTCEGATRMTEETPGKTRIYFEGDLQVNDLKGFGGPFSGMITPVVENIMVKLLPDNFKKISKAVDTYLKASEGK